MRYLRFAALAGLLMGLICGAARAQEKAALDTPAALSGWEISGDAGIDDAQSHGGGGAMRVGPGGMAFW